MKFHNQLSKKSLRAFFLSISFLIFCLSYVVTVHAQKRANKPVSIIFDSDIGPDYDDVGAITILHVLEDRGEAKILATIASNKYEGIAAVLDVFNTWFNRADIPIGVLKGEAVNIRDSQHWTDTLLAKYPHKIKNNNEMPDAITIYRKVLAAQPDNSVTIVTVGFLTNMANLLNSKADNFSPLSGKELIRKKVKLLVSMAGKFPGGKEFNLEKDAKASKEAFDNWPTTVIFSGFEIGAKVKTGLPLIQDNNIHNNPAKDAFSICIPMSKEDAEGRMSWDEITVLVAVKGHQPYYNLHAGRIKVSADGSNSWNENGKGQYYLVEKESPKKVQDIINHLMMQQPENFKIKLNEYKGTFPVQLWYTQILPGTGKVIGKYNGKQIAIKNKYGYGSVLWIPSMIGIGAWVDNSIPLAGLLKNEAVGVIKNLPLHFNSFHENCFMHTLKTSNGYVTVIVNGNSSTEKIDIISASQLKSKLLYGEGWDSKLHLLTIGQNETVVIKWQ